MKRSNICYLFIIFFFLSCTSSPIVRDADGYIEKLFSDVMELNISQHEIFSRYSLHNIYRYTSTVKLELLNTGTSRDTEEIIIIDENNNRYQLKNSIEYNTIFYNLIHTIEIKQQEIFRIYYSVQIRERGRNNLEIEKINVDKIDDLLTRYEIDEFRTNQHRIREEEQKMVRQDELEQRKAQARVSIQRGIASRNADIIMQSLVEIQSFSSNRELLKGEAIIDEAYLEIAKIVTRNNNIQLEWLGATFDNVGDNRLSTAEVLGIFDQHKVYYQDQLIVEQRIDNGYIIYTGYNDARRYIVLRVNLLHVINWDRKNWALDVFMRYVGVTTLRLPSGNIDVPTFEVLYQNTIIKNNSIQ